MPSATSPADRSRPAQRAANLLALGLAARRALDLYQLARCPQRHPLLQVPGSDANREQTVHVIVPLYHEQALADGLVAFWSKQALADPRLHITLVTTAKEGDGDNTTNARLENNRRSSPWPPGIEHLHVSTVHPYRAVQINAALDHIRSISGEPAERTWVAIYNADSRPDPCCFDELRRGITANSGVRAYQQLAQYFRPVDRPSPTVMEAFADHQNLWTYARYSARVRRSRSRWRLWANTSPFSTFGHGEFFRLDLLDQIGGIPDFAYADGLLVGWLLRFGGETLGLLASPDWAEIPRHPRQMVTQHRAWMLGLLNVGDAARHSEPLANDGLSRLERVLLLASHRAIPVLWGLRPIAAGFSILWALARPRSPAAWTALLAFLGYTAVPQIAGRRVRARAGRDDYQPAPLRSRPQGIPAAMLLDGLGFWPALLDKLRPGTAPVKTPR